MNVPFFDLRSQFAQIGSELSSAVQTALESTQYILGPEVEALEAELAAFTGARHAIGVSSGTDALLMSLMALDVGPGDYVIVPAFTFFATAGIVARLHARPVFIDIDPASFNLDVAKLLEWLDRHAADRERVKAIVPVHLYGQCADLPAIFEVAGEIPVLEDAAQAIGATLPATSGLLQAGTIGLTGSFSFFPTKNLGGVGDGGLVTTNDADLATRLTRFRNHGMFPKYHHPDIGGNFRLDAVQAAALRVKLRYLDQWNDARRRNALVYDAHLRPPVVTPRAVWGADHHVYHQYVIRVPERRDALRDHLQRSGIGCEIYYPLPLHLQPCFASLNHREGDFPAAERAAREVLALPIYPELTEEQLMRVCDAVNGFFA